ncbi:CGNR zinc finger domain-containing protein [Streptomyces sp. S186]|uniref:CGNR zinc finger domain-containing protein n=1 Tax=Streptomyces sp. S186 TaxID=3434395 RepID=UPI003F67E0E9
MDYLAREPTHAGGATSNCPSPDGTRPCGAPSGTTAHRASTPPGPTWPRRRNRPECGRVYIDFTLGGQQRYCSHACANRDAVRRHRARRQ